MAFKAPPECDKGGPERLQRPLGQQELHFKNCSSPGAMNIICGLTLVTRHQIDEGLMKCSLQEFQHMFPHLTSRLKVQAGATPHEEPSTLFSPMECPLLPLDTFFTCRDMLHAPFDEEQGPLWRVQHITEATMEAAKLGLGPELAAIVEDDADSATRWRYFLRYMQGRVNQRNIEPFDATEEGFRNFILFTFHPSVTDTVGVFHMLRQFLVILDSILVLDGNTAPPPDVGVVAQNALPPPIDPFLSSQSYSLREWATPSITSLRDYIYPRKSPLECWGNSEEQRSEDGVQVLRGWLSETETRELLAIMDEDDSSLHGVLLTASVISISRMLETEEISSAAIKISNDINLRQFNQNLPKIGCLSSSYEADYPCRDVTTRSEFWKIAHENTVKHQLARDQNSHKIQSKKCLTPYFCEMSVASFGNLGLLFRNKGLSEVVALDSIQTWNKPLNEVQHNIRLEDVFHVVNGRGLGVPFHQSVHILHGKLNYFLTYDTHLVPDQRHALMIRDETINVLRMAVDIHQD